MRAYCEVAGGDGSRHGAGIGAEVSAKGASPVAEVARLALRAARQWFGDIGCTAYDHMTVMVFRFEPCF